MEQFFIFLELMIPIAAVFLILKKGSLAIVYIPTLFFANTLFGETKYIPGPLYFYMFIGLLLYFVFFNLPFFKRNIYANLIIIYFFFLVLRVDDFTVIKKDFLNVMWLFVCIPLIPEIYKFYSRETVIKNVNISIFVLMSLFVVNVILATYFKFSPKGVYGLTSGVLFGKLSVNYYNIFPFATYFILRKGMKDNNIYYLILYFVSMFLIFLTLRRSVMALSLLGSLFVMVELMKFQDIKKLFLYGIIMLSVFFVVISQTSFLEQFIERVERRNLEDKELEEEGRVMEFGLVYRDLFVYFDYNPFIGYGLFDSSGNYGKKILGSRPLHTDPTVIVHSSGFLGLFLYILMFSKAFYLVWSKSHTKGEKLQFLFISICFLGFFFTGRFTVAAPMLMMLIIFFIPISKKRELKKMSPAILNPEKNVAYENY